MIGQDDGFADCFGLAVPGLVAVLCEDEGLEVREGVGGMLDLRALASRRRACGREEGMVVRAPFELCDAEGVEAAFGDDERPQLSGFCCGVDGEEGAGSAGCEAARPVGGRDLEACERAVAVPVGEQDPSVPVAADRRARGVQRVSGDAAPDQPWWRGMGFRGLPGIPEGCRGLWGGGLGLCEPGTDIGEGQPPVDHEVDDGSVVGVVLCVEVDPVSVAAFPEDELWLSLGPQHRTVAGRGLVVPGISPLCCDVFERPALEGVEVEARAVIARDGAASTSRRR